MKPLLAILLLTAPFRGGGVLAAVGQTCVPPSGSGPAISFAERFVELGRFYADSARTCRFQLVNTGDSTLVISRITTDCGCTTAKHSAEAVAPGDSATITVRFDPRGRRPGPFRKIVRVRSNAVNAPLERLYISGTVKPNDKTW